jgi:uncharacterized lipoprotein YddW (UPF0748 family)
MTCRSPLLVPVRCTPRLLLVAAVVSIAATPVGHAQVMPQGAPRDMSRVVLRDSTIFPPIVKREFRGVWVSPAADGDWPSRQGLSAAQQQAELVRLLDRARAIGLNAVVFHVRLSGDALYETPLAPWSAKLTGRQGVSPGYDPLAFIVREAHVRGLQVHAWFNPFRASLDGRLRAASNHVTRIHPSWVRRYGREQWIDPGVPDARASVLATITDVVQRYDIDGVHLDDFFYPYRETRTTYYRVGRGKSRHTVSYVHELDFPDASSWIRYGKRAKDRRWTDRDDWRRHNIDDFVQKLYEQVHAAKPWVSVGISPFGIWRPGSPPGVEGLDAYREIYADARKWLREGWVDYLAPQLYWPLDASQNRFRALDIWWRSQNPLGRHVWPGLYTAGAVGRFPWPFDEIPRQITLLRFSRAGTMEANGHIHFRLNSLIAPAGPLNGALGDRLQTDSYNVPALVPEMPWLGGNPPAAPLAALAEPGDDDRPVLLLAPGDSTALAWWLVQSRDADGRWTMSLLPSGTQKILLAESGANAPDVVSVSAIDRVGQASGRTVVRVVRVK